jgi:DNA repair protein RadC
MQVLAEQQTEEISTLEAKPQPHHLGHRKRLKEKFLKAPSVMADYEILEMLLFSSSPRKDVKPLAKKLLQVFGGIDKVFAANIAELKKIDGMNETAIASIKIIPEAVNRMLYAEAKEKPVLNSWIKLLDYLRAEMGGLGEEQFRVLFLNSKNMLIANEVQSEGTINHTMAYPREIVKRALELRAASIILVHNHPSGDLTPSRADIELTHQIIAAAKPLGLNVHDHVVIAGNGHYSFKTKGII